MTTINIRIEKELKNKSSKILEKLGLDMSSAIKLFLSQVVIDKSVPFVPSLERQKIRAKWDRESAEAKKNSGYLSASELIKKALK